VSGDHGACYYHYSCRRQAFIGVSGSVILHVCLFVRTIEQKRLKLKSPNLAYGLVLYDSPSRVLVHQLILDQKVLAVWFYRADRHTDTQRQTRMNAVFLRLSSA